VSAVDEQTIWLAARTTAFTEICEACLEEHDVRGGPPPTVSGRLDVEDAAGWATCARGHTVRVLRLRAPTSAGVRR
jgi:hypothetical protein